MGHDDPKNPHHHHSHHHQHDELIATGAPRKDAAPGAGESDKKAAGDSAQVHVHAHAHADVKAGGGEGVHSHAGSAGGAAADGGSAPAGKRVIGPTDAKGKLLHFDCFSGLSGDMIVGALLDLGVPREPIQSALESLPLAGFDVGATGVVSHAIAATKFMVRAHDDQPHRTFRDVKVILEKATLDDGVRKRALATFQALAVAEGRIHRIDPDEVHFHEVGAIDAIVDIVSASAALEYLGARVTCAPLPMGRGFTKSEHGIIPLPAPAVLELLQGIPTVDAGLEGELVTPTGAAIVRANATEFVRWPAMRPVATGFGAGTRVLPDRPNLLRVVLGEPVVSGRGGGGGGGGGTFVVIESNLDDATPELIAHATDALLRAGALDAWTQSVGMKKGRPGVMVCALARSEQGEELARVLMRESTTLGVRLRASERVERPRRFVKVQTEFGAVDVKVADGDGLPTTAKPEDDVVRAIASEKGVPARVVHAAAVAAFRANGA